MICLLALLSIQNLQAKTILVISAMEVEKEQVVKELKLSQKKDGYECGTLKKNLVCAALIGVGKVNAAMNTQKLIQKLKPQQIIFSGIAGAVNPKLNIGDVIIGNAFFQHDYGFQSNGGLTTHKPGLMPELGGDAGQSDDYIYKLENQPHFKHFIASTEKASKLLKTISNLKRTTIPAIHIGVIASGDQFIASKDRKSELAKMTADAVEMEGAAACYVAINNNTECFIIRSISDSSSDEAITDYPKFFKEAATNSVILIKEYLLAI